MVHIQDLDTQHRQQPEDIIQNSSKIQSYIHNEDADVPITNAFFLTEKIVSDFKRDPGSIP